jgi:uroporphyrin-III C-methyltransferase / precorrin-2 dehydrogenase / sirohydrochlorin ferrochelatase
VDYLPLFHKLTNARCVVVGGGIVAARKIRLLNSAGARVIVIAPDLCEELSVQLSVDRLTHVDRLFEISDLEGATLVIAATDDPAVNHLVSESAQIRNIPVNVVDDAALSTVIFPSIVDRNPILIAISSSGKAPTLSRQLRGRLEAMLPKHIGAFAEYLGRKRLEMRALGKRLPRAAWERLAALGPERAEAEFEKVADASAPATGWVGIVGAGPGDPELITLKALQLLQRADVVLYDNLVNRAILDYARRDAEQIYVGKKRALVGARQDDIHERMLSAAKTGKNVVRLKGGDPFIFGRGGEEIASLVEEGVQCIVVPGITAALGAASYAGIPLTYRNLSQSVRFVTGHRARGSIEIDWRDFAKPGQTLVFYMGLFNLPEISALLIENGLAPHTPAALVENATLPQQRVLVGTIGDLPVRSVEEGISGPTTVIVGEVVSHRKILGLQHS